MAEPAVDVEDEGELGEVQVAEYLMLLLAVDTFAGYVEDITGSPANDEQTRKGIRLLRLADSQYGDNLRDYFLSKVTREESLRTLKRTFNVRVTNAEQAGRRALTLKTALNRGGAATLKAVFDEARPRTAVKTSIAASMLDDPAAALDRYAALPVRNLRIKTWIKDARSIVGEQTAVHNPVESAAVAVLDHVKVLKDQKVAEEGTTGADAVHKLQDERAGTIERLQEEATEAARAALEVSGEEDKPPSRSEVIGLAAAVAAAAVADMSSSTNVPESLRRLDPEQQAAALTDGRVLVAAGAGAGKCVRGDTLIRTACGLIPIADFATQLEPGQESTLTVQVFGLNGLEPTSTILHNGLRSTLRVTTHHGYEIEGTANHPIWVLRDATLQWVTLGDLRADDVVVIDRREGCFPEAPYRIERRKFAKVTNSEPTQIPEELTPQVAALLGYIVSEGHVVYGPHSVVNLTTTDPEQLALYEAAVTGIVPKWTVQYNESARHWYLRFYRRANVEALVDFGLTCGKAPTKEVPKGILRSPKTVVRAFLRALFDGDGGFCRKEICYDSSSETLARQVHVLLLSFGIVSRLRFRPNAREGCWNITVGGENARAFLRDIGFNLKRKQNSAEAALLGLKSNPNLDVVPGVAGLFHDVMDGVARVGVKVSEHPKYHAFKCYRRGTRRPSKKMVEEFLAAYPLDGEAYESLQLLARQPWLYDSVDDIQESESIVYDFVVPGTHSFSGGGFVNHNSTTLVARVKYLVDERKAEPSRMIVSSFNKKAADELKTKIGKAIGGERASEMNVGTLHGLFRDKIGKYGSSEEKAMFRGKDSILTGSAIGSAVNRLWRKCFATEQADGAMRDAEAPNAKQMMMAKTKWSGNGITPAMAKAQARNQAERAAALWYEMYEGLKGAIPGWKPTCENRAEAQREFDNFLKKNRLVRSKDGGREYYARIGDFDDMITVFLDILRRNPEVRRRAQKAYDHVMIDECQDLNETQNAVLELLTETITDGADGRSFWMVGDDRQSIYAFRGARPDIFTARAEKPDWKTRLIRTNYRCPPEVVGAANKLIANNEDQIPMEANAAPGRAAGEASILAEVYPDEARTAIAVASEIKDSWDSKSGEISDNAVLCRTNKELNSYETALLMRGIPYARKGASSFLSSPETKAFLGYVTLATDADAEKTQQALRDVLNKPNRFFVSPEQVERAIDLALNGYGRRMGVAKKTIDPMAALRDRDFQEDLVSVLTGDTQGFKAKKAYQRLDELVRGLDDLTLLVQSEEATTKEMFDAVLEMPGTKFKVDPVTGRILGEEPVSFRSELSASIKDYGDEEEEIQDEERPDEMSLGNISFLYELAKSNPEDPGDVEIPPETPKGFWAKMGRLNEKAKELRIDLTAWEKKQETLPPEDRKPAPGVYLGTVHCSPADEPVLTTDGWVPIGDLDPERHRLASYTHTCNQLFWGYIKGEHDGIEGYKFLRSSQPYEGSLLTLATARSKTRVTPDHRIRVKWAENFFNRFVVYLMRRGDWWRVGVAKSGNRPYYGADFKQRVSAEKADACWLLSVHATRVEAILEEARVQAFYGITGLTFEANGARRVTSEQIQAVHEACKASTADRVDWLLSDYGLDKKHPLYVGQGREIDMRSAFDIQARNCLSGYMLLPVVSQAFIDGEGPREVWTKPEWHPVTISREYFEGDVHSLVVLPHRYYVSGGAIVHNSVKGAQWPTVYVQMAKGKFPMEPRKKDDDEESDSPERLAEKAAELASERRLAYVALTRPSKNLRVVAPAQINGKPAGMSQFLAEAGLKLGENVEAAGAPKTAAFFVEDAEEHGVF